jgi:hypothetical protein
MTDVRTDQILVTVAPNSCITLHLIYTDCLLSSLLACALPLNVYHGKDMETVSASCVKDAAKPSLHLIYLQA